MKIYNITGIGSSLTGSFSGSFIGDGSNITSISSDNISFNFTAISSSAQIADDISGSLGPNADLIRSLTASSISGSNTALSSSIATRFVSTEASVSSLNAASSSYLLNTTDTLTGDLTVTGKVTAQEFHTEYVSSSIVYQSGSTKFGDTSDDIHQFTGSLTNSGSITTNSTFRSNGLWTNTSSVTYWGNGIADTSYGGLTWDSGYATVFATPGNVLYLGSNGNSADVIVDLNGNVGIGGSISPQAQLHIDNNTSNSYATLRLEGANRGGQIDMYNTSYPVSQYLTDQSGNIYISTSGAFGGTSLSTRFTILTGGNVGIGYTDPAYQLQVLNNIGLRANNQNIKAITGTGWGYSPTGYKVVMLGDNNTSNFTTVSIGYDPSANANGAFSGDGREVLFRRGAQFVTPNSADDSFYLYNLVLLDGNVGIGTNSPKAPLHINSGGSYNTVDANNRFIVESSTHSPYILFSSADNKDNGFHFHNSTDNTFVGRISYQHRASGDFMHFRVGTASGEGHVTFDSNGRVGIGTNTPSYTLDVVGPGAFVSNGSSRVLYLRQNANNAGNIIQFQNESGSDVWEVVGRNNQFYIYNTNLSQMALYIDPTNGRVGINQSGSSYNLHVNGSFAATSVTETSALRFKENILPLESQLENVKKLNPVTFDWKEDNKHDIGFIAEEVEQVIPDLVSYADDEIHGLHYAKFSAVLVKAIQEQQQQIETLKAEIELLKQNK